MLSRDSQTFREIWDASKAITQGVVLSIDPSIGSTSSMPGYAVLVEGEMKEMGTLDIDPEGSVPQRLNRLNYLMRRLIERLDPDVLVYEKIPVSAHAGRSQVSHASLLMALGAILSISGPDYWVGIMPISWKKWVRPEYRKGDAEDAAELGWVVLQQALLIEQEKAEGKKRKGKRK